MKMLMTFVLAMALVVPVFSDDKTASPTDPDMADCVAAAQTKLKARTAAATQAVVSDDPAVLKKMILDQKGQIEAWKAQVARLTQEIEVMKKGVQATAAPAPAPGQTSNDKVIVVSAYDFAAWGEWHDTNNNAPSDISIFGALSMNAVGVGHKTKVLSVVDETTAIIEVHVGFPDSEKPVLIEGISTKGLADDAVCHLNCWLKIVEYPATWRDDIFRHAPNHSCG